MIDSADHVLGSGNVFQDLGLSDAERALVKSDLAIAISRVIREGALTQIEAARLMGLDQPKVSAITRGRLAGFSVERLMECLRSLRQDVVIYVRPSEREHGRLCVIEE